MQPFECTLGLDEALPPCDPRIATNHAYWRRIRPAGAPLPGRQHFDPAAVPRLLPTIRLYDVFRNPWRFRYRLMGSELARILGRDLTGQWFDAGPRGSRSWRSYEDLMFVAAGSGLSYHRGFPIFSAAEKDHLTSERILLPLARDGTTVDILLGLSIHHPASADAVLQHTA